MYCFGATPPAATDSAYYYSSSSSSSMTGRPWRWWRARCAGIAAAVGSRLRRSSLISLKRMGVGIRRRRRDTVQPSSAAARRRCRHGLAPVYVDDLYAHHYQYQYQPPRPQPANNKAFNAAAVAQEASNASGGGGNNRLASPVRAVMRSSNRNRGGGVPAQLRSPGRGGGVLAVVKGMGEVDLRAELFIRRFKEDMRLQSQRSAEEFHAMLARGL